MIAFLLLPVMTRTQTIFRFFSEADGDSGRGNTPRPFSRSEAPRFNRWKRGWRTILVRGVT